MSLSRHVLLAAALALAAAVAAAERPLRVDPEQTRIDIVVKATVDSFTGRLQSCSPAITIGDDGRVASARVSFHFRDVLTGKPKRDRAMHDWQRTDQFPDGEFVLESLAPGPDGATQASGQLTFHGVTRPVSFPVSVTKQDSVYAIDGDAAVDVRDYGLPVIKMFAVLKVDPVVHVKFHLQARLDHAG